MLKTCRIFLLGVLLALIFAPPGLGQATREVDSGGAGPPVGAVQPELPLDLPYCGNGQCNPGPPNYETCSNCPQDCPPCYCGNGTCDPGETCTSCSQDCGVCPDSCSGRCELGVAPSGCSCSPNCGYLGTCCKDIVAACSGFGGTPLFPDPFSFGAGTEFFQITSTLNVNLNQATYWNTGGAPTKPVVPVGVSAPGFNQISLGGLSAQGEQSRCELGQANGMWTVTAGNTGGSESFYASCTASAFRWPASLSPPPTVSGETRAESHNDSSGQTINMGGTANSIAYLTYVRFEQTTASTDTMCSTPPNGAGYELRADTDAQSDAWCGARLLSWDPSSGIQKVPGNVGSDQFYVGSCRWDTGGYDYDCPDAEEGLPSNGYAREVDMGPKASAASTRVCFLSRYETGYSSNFGISGDVQCQIVEKEDRLFLRAKPNMGRTWAKCNARCLDYPNSMAFPPAPGVKGVGAIASDPGGVPPEGDAGVAQIGAGGAGSGGSQTGVCALGADCPGGRLNLYRSNDGVYDRPVLFVGGVDPTNEGGVWSSVRDLAAGIRGLRQAGVDVWFLKPSGEADIRVAAREVARAIVKVVTYDPDGAGPLLPFNQAFPGRKIVVVGNSQGALDSRIALASWGQGNLYQPSGSAEYVPGVAAIGAVPLSLWISIAGPHLGANASSTAQVIINEAFRRLGEDNSSISIPSGPVALLNALPPQEMLLSRTRIDCASTSADTADGFITEWCPHHIGRDLGARWVTKDHDVPGDGSNGDDWVAQGGCNFETEPRASFASDVDIRGTLHNGFPQSMKAIALSDGSFSPQSCENMADSAACTVTGTPNPFTNHLQFAKLNLAESGGIFGICARDTRVHARLTPADLPGGDLRDSFVSGTDVGALPNVVYRIELGDDFPLSFVPTESALGCPGTAGQSDCTTVTGTTRKAHLACDGVCRSVSQSAGRFDNVFSNTNDKNGPHRTLAPLQQRYVLAYLYEYAVKDGDGLFGTGADNPFYPAGGIPAESADCDDSIPEGTPCDGPDGDACKEGVFSCATTPHCSDTTSTNVEICNGIDDDCDGSVDEGLTGNTELCNGADDNCDGVVDGTCGTMTTPCPDQSAIWEFTASNSQQFCIDEGLCSDARCASRCQQTPVTYGCDGRTTSCPGGTKATYTTGHLLQACFKDNPTVCRCECDAVGATYRAEIIVPCTSCGNGVCDGNDTCTGCPGDCYQTIDLPHGLCVMCDTTGETLCGPGIFPWCCPP